jgi:hypothetical protein
MLAPEQARIRSVFSNLRPERLLAFAKLAVVGAFVVAFSLVRSELVGPFDLKLTILADWHFIE